MAAVATQRGVSGMTQWAAGLLPTPHLLDAAWWFDRATVEAFRVEVEALPQQASVVFLGTPSLFLDAWQRGEGRATSLVDRDPALREHLPQMLATDVQVIDLLTTTPRFVGADLVVADPPWYVNETMAFLVSAQLVARVGAEVKICLPPVGTRPTIMQERRELFRWAAAGGLKLTKLLERRVRYEAPPFEANVFRVTGLSLEEQSRRGDLAVFTVESNTGLVSCAPPIEPIWADHSILQVRWRVRGQSSTDVDSPKLISLGFCDDVFPSCSKRHVDRIRPAVWTSGNRAFCCQNPQRFLTILRSLRGATLKEVAAIAARLYPEHGSEDARAVAQILTLTELEKRELEALKQCPNGNDT